MRRSDTPCVVLDAAHLPEDFSLGDYRRVLIAASVHQHRHEAEIVSFVKRHRADLEDMDTAFLSVSLSEAGAEDADAPPEKRAQAASDAQGMIDGFLAETGWHPSKIRAVAGALLYTQYNFILRFVMKRIAASAGGDTDTSRNYDYTNWAELDRFVEEFTAT
jgi:menaquinone-dependent protoporphyrinogen oxidase